MANQLESALVLALRDTIKWESAGSGADASFDAQSGTLTAVNAGLPFDAKVYQSRDRELAYRDLIVGAAVVEVSIQVGDVWNYSTVKPNLQGPAPFSLPFVGTEAGTMSTQVRHVTNVSIPYDAARYADADLYGRDAIVYECLARACNALFVDPSIPLIDAAGTLIPNTSIWSLAEGQPVRADINPVLPLNRDLFKLPDQNLADRDNQLAGYTAQLVQVLKNPFEHAIRLYVQVDSYGTVQREPDIYSLVTDGTQRTFQTEPAVPGSNKIIYDTNRQTLQWTRERVDEVHVPQLYAMVIPGIEVGQYVETLAAVPDRKDPQYWRAKAGQLNPDGVKLSDTNVYLTTTNSDATDGGIMQYGSASFTVPDQMTFTMGGSLTGGNYRVSVLSKPNNEVEIAGAQNNTQTNGILGGATFDINVASGSVQVKTYIVVGGSGIVYNGTTYLPDDVFSGLTGITTYTQAGPTASTLRQYALSFSLALPAGAWKCAFEYTNLSGTADGFAIKAEYLTPGAETVVVMQDTAPIPWTANNGDVVFTPLAGFDVATSVPFTFTIYWTGGSGQLHIRKLVFRNTDITTGRYAMTGTFVGSTAQVDVSGSNQVPDVLRWHYTSFGSTYSGGIPFVINYTEEPALPIQLQQVQVQTIEYFDTTPLSQRFQAFRQECLDRAERVIQQGYNAALDAYGTAIPTFRTSGSLWTQESTEDWMSLVEVYNPRVRQVPSIVDTGITAGRQYEVETTFVSYGGTVYTEGQKFYGVASAGTVYSGGTVHQVGAFKKSQPGHLGKPALVPHGVYFDDTTKRVMSYYDASLSIPTIMACQAWMIENGIYVAQGDFWLPETLGLTIPTPPNVTVSGGVYPPGSGVLYGLGTYAPGSVVTIWVVPTVITVAGYVDVVFLVDESGSMNTEHQWLGGGAPPGTPPFVPSLLEAALVLANIGAGANANRYALVGFADTAHSVGQRAHKHLVGGGDWGTAAQLEAAAASGPGLSTTGGTEDGYDAISFSLNAWAANYVWRAGAVKVLILVTDEDRDTLSGDTKGSITTLLQSQTPDALIAMCLDAQFLDVLNTPCIGRKGTEVYIKTGAPPYWTTSTFLSIPTAFGNTVFDYCDVAEVVPDPQPAGGSEWDLSILRNGGTDATAFTNAFTATVTNQISYVLSYTFSHWFINGVVLFTGNPYTFTVTSNTVVQAYMV
jgi:hypothetical protein